VKTPVGQAEGLPESALKKPWFITKTIDVFSMHLKARNLTLNIKKTATEYSATPYKKTLCRKR
jgi:hypothetical protein